MANRSEPSAIEVFSLFEYFANFILKAEPYFVRVKCFYVDFDASTRMDAHFIRFIVIFVECHVFTCNKPNARTGFITWLPSPTQYRGWGKKADMLEGNVLVKKYGGGRQEVWRKVSHYFGFTFRQFVLSWIQGFVTTWNCFFSLSLGNSYF